MRARSLILWVVAAFAVTALIAAPSAHVVHASTSGVVISAMYGGGGGTGATYTHDYIELFNAGTTTVDINGWSVQYRHNDGMSWQKTQFTVSTPLLPGQYYLIQADGGATGAALPTPDATNAADMRRPGNFMVALMSTLDTIQGENPYDTGAGNNPADVVDFFGGGDPTTVLPPVFEGAVRTGILDATTAWFRNGAGCQDTNNNLNDFAAGPVAGMARNTATTLAPCPPMADLTVAISGAPNPILTGGSTTFSVEVDNIGAAAATNAVITVDLSGTAVVGATVGTPSAGECSYTSPTVTCNVPSIAVSGGFDFTFTVSPVNSGTIVADAEVSSTPVDTAGNNADQATVTVNVPMLADVSVSIAESADPVDAGTPITYTVTVTNSGNAAAANTTLTVALGGTAFPNAVTGLSAGCTYTSPNVDCNIGAVAAGGGTVVASFTITPTVAGDITLAATVAADAPETGGNNTDSETTTVNAVIPSDVSVDIVESADPVDEGTPINYTVTVTNSASVAADNTTLTVALGGTAFPDAVTALSAGCSYNSPNVECTFGTVAASGGTAVATFTITPTTAGNITLDATVAADDPETGGNNTASETTTVNAVIPTGNTGSIDSTDSITTGGDVTVTVIDQDLIGAGTVEITAVGSSGDNETIALTETATPGTFTGTITVANAAATAGNGVLEETGGTIIFTYIDALDAEGDVDTALTDTTTVSAPVPTVGSFELVSPDEGQILRTTTTTFQWTEAAEATTYSLFVSNLSNNTRLGENYTVTKNAVDICAAGVCSVASTELVADLDQGTYSWTVIASNGSSEAEASNGPNLFTVDLDGIELVVNGGLNSDATGWTFTQGAKRKCKADWGNNSDCAIKLSPGSKAHQRGVIGPILAKTDTAAGDVLTVSAAVRTNKAAKQRVVMVVINYVNTTAGANGNGKDKFKMFVEQATVGYETFTADFVLAGEVRGGRIVVANMLPKGNLRVDDVSVILQPAGSPAPRLDAQTSVDGLLPVPAAPDNFRGSN